MQHNRFAIACTLSVLVSACVPIPKYPYPPDAPDSLLQAYRHPEWCDLRGIPRDCSQHARLVRGLFRTLDLEAPACAQVTVAVWKIKDDDDPPWQPAKDGERGRTYPIRTEVTVYNLPSNDHTVGGADERGDVSACMQFPLYSWTNTDKRDMPGATVREHDCHSGCTLNDITR